MVTVTKEDIATDLSMLTGKVSSDISYLVYLVIKDSPNKVSEPTYSEIVPGDTVDSLEDWFNSIGG